MTRSFRTGVGIRKLKSRLGVVTNKSEVITTASRIIVLSAIAALLFSCGKKTDPETEARLRKEEYIRHRTADSLKEIATADSLFAVADTVEGPIPNLKQPNLRKSKHESYRLTAGFSWGQSPVGPLFSAMAQDRDSIYVFVTISFPDPERRRTESVKEISKEDFMKIAYYFDSIDFQSMPRVLYSDTQHFDADQFYAESVKDGTYHLIARTKPIERAVYILWTDVLTIVRFDPKVVEMFREKSEP